MKNINKIKNPRMNQKEVDKVNMSKKDASELQKESTIIDIKIKRLKRLLKKSEERRK